MDTISAIGLSPQVLGGLALAVATGAAIAVNVLKGIWYRRAPLRWQAWLPDRWVWPGLAFLLCIGVTVGARLDYGTRIFREDWPPLPWWVGAIMTGVAFGLGAWQAIYKLAIAPAQKAKAIAAVAKHVARHEPPVQNPTPVPTPTPVQNPTPVAPEPDPAPESTTLRLLTGWPVHDPTHPQYVVLTKGNKKRIFEIDLREGM